MTPGFSEKLTAIHVGLLLSAFTFVYADIAVMLHSSDCARFDQDQFSLSTKAF
jgi:hypothetical protein